VLTLAVGAVGLGSTLCGKPSPTVPGAPSNLTYSVSSATYTPRNGHRRKHGEQHRRTRQLVFRVAGPAGGAGPKHSQWCPVGNAHAPHSWNCRTG